MNIVTRPAFLTMIKDKLLFINQSDLESVLRKLFQEVLDKQEPKQEEILFSIAETTKLLGVDRTTLWRWRKDGYLKPVLLGNRIRYPMSVINSIKKGGVYNG